MTVAETLSRDLERDPDCREAAAPAVRETDARVTLRRQIAHLERELAEAVVATFPGEPLAVAAPSRAAGPRLLGLGDLEEIRDDLAERLVAARRALSDRARRQEDARALLERMRLAPGEHKFRRIYLRDLGEHGCGAYEVRPRLGVIGMLAGWWHVKLSSGCPLATRQPS